MIIKVYILRPKGQGMEKSQLQFILIVSAFLPSMAIATIPYQDRMLFPEDYKVYYKPNVGVVNHPFEGGIEKTLPTVNYFQKTPGCYIACYSHQEYKSVYPVARDIFVMGQIRVSGHYEDRICKPKAYETKDISAEESFKKLCQDSLPDQCSNLTCWVGGDTGGWYGVQMPIE